MSSITPDTEFTLQRGSQKAVVAPFGAALRQYKVATSQGEWDVIWGYSGYANKNAGQGDVLIPFPSRVKEGRYSFQGHSYQMELNDKDGPNAIHGFLRSELWQHERHGEQAVSFFAQMRPKDFALRGYPFSLDVSVRYELDAQGLVTRFEIRNVGDNDAPAGVGFHPYFTVGQGPIDWWHAQMPAVHYLEFQNLVPTGRVLSVEGSPLDYRESKLVGSNKFNFCYCDLERDASGYAQASVRDKGSGHGVRLRMDPSFNYLVVYSGDAIAAPHTRKAFALEPLTCATDAFNHPEWGLKVLKPGEKFSGHYIIEPF